MLKFNMWLVWLYGGFTNLNTSNVKVQLADHRAFDRDVRYLNTSNVKVQHIT